MSNAEEKLEHWDQQAHERYRFLIGEWRGARRAKCTASGRFVSIKEVKKYLNGKGD